MARDQPAKSALFLTAPCSGRECPPQPTRLPHLLLPQPLRRPRRAIMLRSTRQTEDALNLDPDLRRVFIAPLIILAVLSAACSLKPSANEVAASVDGRKIYRADLEKYFQNQTAGANQPLSEDQATSLRLSILRELIENEILMRRAEKLGLLATDEEVERKLNEIKSPYTVEEFDKRLKERKITLDDFKRDLRRSVTVDKVLNREITSKINISDADIANYYNAHKAEFNLIEPQYHLAHIFVTTQPNAQVRNLKNDKAQNEAEARKKIQMILNRLDS